jgi:hypothetical protein
MVTTNYLLMLGVGTVFVLLLGLASHAAHAYLARPDSWEREIPGRHYDPTPDAEYDNDGFWEFASVRNYLYHAGGGVLILWGFGLWYSERQDEALAQVCGAIANLGLVPVFCM